MTKIQTRTAEQFLEHFRKIPRHTLSRALNKITLGQINWSGCSKGRIAEAWASAFSEHTTYGALRSVELTDIDKKLEFGAPAAFKTAARSIPRDSVTRPVTYPELLAIVDQYFKALPVARRRRELGKLELHVERQLDE